MWQRHGLVDEPGALATGVMSLIAARDQAAEAARIRDEELLEARGEKGGLEAEYKRVRAEGERLAVKNEELKQRLGEAEASRGVRARGCHGVGPCHCRSRPLLQFSSREAFIILFHKAVEISKCNLYYGAGRRGISDYLNIWREKMALEKGTGTESLQSVLSEKILDDEFGEKRQFYLKNDGVYLIDKEQMFYYEIFRNQHGSPSEVYPDKDGKQCQKCKAYVKTKIGFCKVCGNYPIQ